MSREFDGLIARRARLIAERDGSESIDYPDRLMLATDDPRTAELLDSESSIFETRRRAIEGQISILEQQKKTLREEISYLDRQLDEITEQRNLIGTELRTSGPWSRRG